MKHQDNSKPRMVPIDIPPRRCSTRTIRHHPASGYAVDEIPDPVKIDVGFAAYESSTKVDGNVMHYTRTYTVRQVTLPAESMPTSSVWPALSPPMKMVMQFLRNSRYDHCRTPRRAKNESNPNTKEGSFMNRTVRPSSSRDIAARTRTSFCRTLRPSRGSCADPTPEELHMTSQPEVPGATAVILNRDEFTEDKNHMFSIHNRIKVLTEGGKEYGNVELDYSAGHSGYQVTEISGCTIHPDGTKVPFTGKPYDKLVEKTKAINTWPRSSACPMSRLAALSTTATSCVTTIICFGLRAG